MNPTNKKSEYNWVNVIFFTLTPIIAVGGTLYLLLTQGVHPLTWALAFIMMMATGLSITAGYHRLFSHRSYQSAGPIRILFLLFGAAAFQGQLRVWASEHRYHHRYVDQERDPYNIKEGFWYAHIGWLFKAVDLPDFQNIKDLDQDPLIRLQDRYYVPIATFMCFFMPMAVAALWGDWLGGLLVAGFARMVLVHHSTFCINSVCHYLGRQPYSDQHSSRDSALSALFTFGEGYHNFHHEFQYDYRNGIRLHQWDPTKWLITLMAILGLASRLRKADHQRILQARIRMDQKHFNERISGSSDAFRRQAEEILQHTRERLQSAYQNYVELKTQYRMLRHEQIDSVRRQLDDLRADIREARREVRQAMTEWQALIRGRVAAMG